MHLTRNGGWQRGAEKRAVNPQKRVPALELSTGEVMLQSLAIIENLDEDHPEPPLMPKIRSSARRCAPCRRSSPATFTR